MRKIILFLILSSFAAGGCVSTTQYQQLEGRQAATEQSLEQCQSLLAQKSQEFLESRQAHQDCLDLVSSHESRHREAQRQQSILAQEKINLENANALLSARIDELGRELDTTISVVDAQRTVIERVEATKKSIEASLKQEIADKEILIQDIKGRLTVTFVDKILFDSGSATINPRGRELLRRIAPSLKDNTDHSILVEGHTDNVPISQALAATFPTNWELSAARAIAVVRFLSEQAGLAPNRLAASGHSYYRPLASNDTAQGRSQNRRIEIVLVPEK
ncbi:MAG: OmpA family protein [Desulfatibacillaceae bacterium]|nr:OmpA family protein [Desulfatibacillaceae bacterium]